MKQKDKKRVKEFKKMQIVEYTSAYSNALWHLSRICELENDDMDLYEVIADITRNMSDMSAAFEQMYVHALNLERKNETKK